MLIIGANWLMTKENIANKNLVLAVACALIDKDRRVLIAKRGNDNSNNGLNNGKWEFPGGKIQKGETPEQAIIRELKEELAVNTNQACLAPLSFVSHNYHNFHLLMPLYVCRKWQNEPQNLVHEELKWVRVNHLRKFELIEADKALISHLCDLLL